ncbi:hypothetical protein E4U41_004489 [Claviceps citrina]|nr:hypothetical protein E4U41_004489 [Claviceps citrina]
MMLPNLSVGFTSTIIFGSFLSCIQASRETSKDDVVVDLGSVAQLSHVVARELPPNYETPTYGYDYPPSPYQYDTSTLASVSFTPISSESIPSTAIDTTTVTTIDQSTYTSDTTISTTDSHIVTNSQASQSTDETASTSSKTWVESSVLGITGTSTWTTSEGPTFSSANTSSTTSETTTSTGILSSLPVSSGYLSTNGSIIVSSTSNANNTMTQTMTGIPNLPTTDRVTSSELSFESSQLPITASLSSRSNYSSFYTTPSKRTSATLIVTGPGVSSSESSSSQSSLTWPPVFNITSSVSASPVLSTIYLSSGVQTSMKSGEQTTAWPTSYSEMSTRSNSSQMMSSATSPPVLSQTVTDGTPRTKTYFSSQWANSTSLSTKDGTFPGPTQIWTITTSIFSFPTSFSLTTGYTVPLSSGIVRNTTSGSTASASYSSPPNSTVSQPTSSGSSWIQSSVLGTGISLTSSEPTLSVPTQSSAWTRRTDSASFSSPPFQNSTTAAPPSGTGYSTRTSMGNTTYRTPWTSSTASLTTVTSIVWSSSKEHSSQPNSTSSQSTWVTYRSSSASITTGFTSGNPTTQTTANSTYHWPTTIKSSLSSVRSSTSTSFASSSEAPDPGVTRTTLNSTSVHTPSKTLTSTIQQWPNSTYTLQPTLSSSIYSTSRVDTSSASPSSTIVTNTSYVPSTSWSETSAQQSTTSLVSSRWVNTTTMSGEPGSTTISTTILGTTTASNGSTLTHVTATTWSTSIAISSSVTTDLNTTSGRLTITSSATEPSSETTLWPTIRTSTTSSRCVRKKKTQSSGSQTQPRTAIETHLTLTTLKTLISTERGTPEPRASDGPSSTSTANPKTTHALPKNPNFPWGGDSPIHRHQSVDALGAGIPKGSLWTRWANKVKHKMRFARL